MKKKKQVNKPDPIFIKLYKPEEFDKFFRGFKEFLEKRLSKREVIGKNYSYSYFTCGQPHDPRNPDWKPFEIR